MDSRPELLTIKSNPYWHHFRKMNLRIGIAESALMFMLLTVMLLSIMGTQVKFVATAHPSEVGWGKVWLFLIIAGVSTLVFTIYATIQKKWAESSIDKILNKLPKIDSAGKREWEGDADQMVKRINNMYGDNLWQRRKLAFYAGITYVGMIIIVEGVVEILRLTAEGTFFPAGLREGEGGEITGFGYLIKVYAGIAGLVIGILYSLRVSNFNPLAPYMYGISKELRRKLLANALNELPWYKKSITDMKWIKKRLPDVTEYSLYKLLNYIMSIIVIVVFVHRLVYAETGSDAVLNNWNHGWFFWTVVLVTIASISTIGACQYQYGRRLRVASKGIEKDDVITALLFSEVPPNAAERHFISEDGSMDVTTGVETRASFERRERELLLHLALELNGDQAAKHFTYVYVDFDDFKRINTRFKHAGGDHALKYVGAKMNQLVDNANGWYAGRLGGDEFAFLMIGSDKDTVEQNVRQFEQNVRRDAGTNIDTEKYPGLDKMVSLSIGVFTFDGQKAPEWADVESARREANHRTFLAKETGKGRVVADKEFEDAHNPQLLEKTLRQELATLVSGYGQVGSKYEKCIAISVIASIIAEARRLLYGSVPQRKEEFDHRLNEMRALVGHLLSLNSHMRSYAEAREEVDQLRKVATELAENNFYLVAQNRLSALDTRMLHGTPASYRGGLDGVINEEIDKVDQLVGFWVARASKNETAESDAAKNDAASWKARESLSDPEVGKMVERLLFSITNYPVWLQVVGEVLRGHIPAVQQGVDQQSWRVLEMESNLDRKCRELNLLVQSMIDSGDRELLALGKDVQDSLSKRLKADVAGREAILYYDLIVSRMLIRAEQQQPRIQAAQK
jgi:diguanylate cyclase (GGDEF)-like protein